MNKRAVKDEFYGLIVQLVEAMGNAHRLETSFLNSLFITYTEKLTAALL